MRLMFVEVANVLWCSTIVLCLIMFIYCCCVRVSCPELRGFSLCCVICYVLYCPFNVWLHVVLVHCQLSLIVVDCP